MSAKFIRRIVEVFIAIFFIGGFLQIGRAVAAMFDGKFGTVRWPVEASAFDLQAPVGEGVQAWFTDATLAVPGQPFWHSVDLLFSLTNIGIFIAALMLLRSVLANFTSGDLVDEENAIAMRKIGLLLLAACGLSVVRAILLQSAILTAVEEQAGTVLHPSISWDVSGMTNVWLHYDVPIFTFAMGGLALLFAEAFRAGVAYRKDSESVV